MNPRPKGHLEQLISNWRWGITFLIWSRGGMDMAITYTSAAHGRLTVQREGASNHAERG